MKLSQKRQNKLKKFECTRPTRTLERIEIKHYIAAIPSNFETISEVLKTKPEKCCFIAGGIRAPFDVPVWLVVEELESDEMFAARQQTEENIQLEFNARLERLRETLYKEQAEEDAEKEQRALKYKDREYQEYLKLKEKFKD